MGKIRAAFGAFVSTLFTSSAKKREIEENYTIKSLRKHIRTLEEVYYKQADMLKEISKENSKHNKQNMEEKVIDAAINLFTKPQTMETGKGSRYMTTPSEYTPFPSLETGESLTDSEINALLDKAPPHLVSQLPHIDNNTIRAAIKAQGFNASNETIERSKVLAAQRS